MNTTSSLIAIFLLSLGFAAMAEKFDSVGNTTEASGPAAATASANCTSPCPYPTGPDTSGGN